VTLSFSTLSGNGTTGDLTYGGGIYATNSSLVTLNNSTLSGNSALGRDASGGGIFAITSSSVYLINSTVSGNRAAADGGGLWISDSSYLAPANTIVVGNSAGNAGDDVYATYAAAKASLFGQIAGGVTVPITGTAPGDLFAALDPVTGGGLLADNGGPTQTIALLANPTNPAIDAGDNAVPIAAVDQRLDGFPRVLDGDGDGVATIDIGAIEAPARTPPVAQDDAGTTDEQTAVTLDVLANDSDPDGDPLRVGQIEGTDVGPGDTVPLPSGAAVRLNTDGSLRYDPNGAFDGLVANSQAQDVFRYTVTDGLEGFDEALVRMTATGLNDPARLVPQKAFDPFEYIASYPDLIAAFGADPAAGAAHFATAGFREGREVTFDGLEYIASFTDLRSAFGVNRDAGSSHFITQGFGEGRATTFNAFEYIASSDDLIDAFGVDQAAGATHFLTHGVGEGRSVRFDGLEYIAGFNDLRGAFGADADAGAAHFIAAGRDEGRTIRFDGLEYIASHADLIRAFGVNRDAGSIHFIANGFDEGRDPDAFDAEQYLANYSDLQAAFGTDTDAAAAHYIANGFFEGRTDMLL
jgi:hypothetical protein